MDIVKSIKSLKLDWKTGAKIGAILGLISFVIGFKVIPALIATTIGAIISSGLMHISPILAILIPVALGTAFLVSLLIHVGTYAVSGAIIGGILQVLREKKVITASTFGEALVPLSVLGVSTFAILALTATPITVTNWVSPEFPWYNYCTPGTLYGQNCVELMAAWQYSDQRFYSIQGGGNTFSPGSVITATGLFYAEVEGDYNLQAGIKNANKDGVPMLTVPSQAEPVRINSCNPSEKWYASIPVHMKKGEYKYIPFQLEIPASATGRYDLVFSWFKDCAIANQPNNVLQDVTVKGAINVINPNTPTTTTTLPPTTTIYSPPSTVRITTTTLRQLPAECTPGTRQGEIIKCVDGQVQYKYRTCYATGMWSQWANNVVDCSERGYVSCYDTGGINPDKPLEACIKKVVVPSTTTTSTTLPDKCREGQSEIGGQCTDPALLYIIGGLFVFFIIIIVVTRLRR